MLGYAHLRHAVQLVIVTLGVLLILSGCGRPIERVSTPDDPGHIAELWQAPNDIERRDLFLGPGGAELQPREGTTFQFVAVDNSGASPGYDVSDARGLAWSAKIGVEAQSEVAVSRILWAIGFHQPPIYYLANWSLSGAPANAQPSPARFRPELVDTKVIGDWSWHRNPFVGTRPFGGLVVANLILTSWDWKTSNNKIYALAQPRNDVRRWYVVRDLGASLGRFTYPRWLEWARMRGLGQGTKNDLDGFEQQPFLVTTDNGPAIDYRGIYRDVVTSVTPADIRWTCELMSRLSDRQWHDAFRAAGYTPQQTSRYVTKIKEKIAQGLALRGN